MTRATVGGRLHRCWVIVGAVALCGCAEGDRSEPGGTVTTWDSAGMPIVFTEGSVWRPGEEWTLAPEPRLEVGTQSGREPYLFSHVVRAQLLPDGGVLVVHGPGDCGFRIFDRNGTHVRTIGRNGEGPGEFRTLSGRLDQNDRLIAYDFSLARFSIFDLSGALLRTRRLDIDLTSSYNERRRPPVWYDRFGDGGFLGRANLVLPTESGRSRPRFPFLRLDWQTFAVDTIAFGLGEEWVITAADGGEPESVIFSPFTVAVAHDTTVFVSDTKDFWIDQVSRHGRVIRRFGRSFEPDPVDPEDMRAYTDARLAATQSERARRYVRQRLAEAEFAEFEPAHAMRMIVDDAEYLWVRHWMAVPGSGPTRWSVFDTRGRHLGEVVTPAALRVTEIAEDAVVGVWTDELDVQTVRVYDLSKPGGAGHDDRTGAAGRD